MSLNVLGSLSEGFMEQEFLGNLCLQFLSLLRVVLCCVGFAMLLLLET